MIELLKHDFYAVGYDCRAGYPDSGRRVLHGKWLLMDQRYGRGCRFVDCVVGHLLLHDCVHEYAALFVVASICGAGFVKVGFQTVVYVSECIFVDVGDACVQVVET